MKFSHSLFLILDIQTFELCSFFTMSINSDDLLLVLAQISERILDDVEDVLVDVTNTFEEVPYQQDRDIADNDPNETENLPPNSGPGGVFRQYEPAPLPGHDANNNVLDGNDLPTLSIQDVSTIISSTWDDDVSAEFNSNWDGGDDDDEASQEDLFRTPRMVEQHNAIYQAVGLPQITLPIPPVFTTSNQFCLTCRQSYTTNHPTSSHYASSDMQQIQSNQTLTPTGNATHFPTFNNRLDSPTIPLPSMASFLQEPISTGEMALSNRYLMACTQLTHHITQVVPRMEAQHTIAQNDLLHFEQRV